MPRPLVSTALLLLALLAAWPAAAQDDTRLLRTPTVSDRHVAFVYANDLWVAGRGGGEARRLTSGPGMETNPRFSPDGQYVAFTGQYDGNTDVYVVPVEGGEPRRLTFHPGADVVQGWTPDGRAVLFTSGREGFPTNTTKFFTVPVDGGFPEALPIPRGVSGRLSEDGRHIAYRFPQFWDPEWRNYRGGQAQPIWIVSLEDHGLVKPPWEGERQLDPVWLDGVVYFLSERGYMFNVWSFDPRSGELRQRTFHTDLDVKALDAGGGVIAYEQAGRIHLLDPATDEARPLAVHVRGDHLHARPRWVDVEAEQLQHGALSPTGQRAAFEARGQILTAPAEHGDWRNLSNTSEAAHRFPAWSPDGQRIAYFSDASGEYRLVIAPQDGIGERQEVALPEASFFFQPRLEPGRRADRLPRRGHERVARGARLGPGGEGGHRAARLPRTLPRPDLEPGLPVPRLRPPPRLPPPGGVRPRHPDRPDSPAHRRDVRRLQAAVGRLGEAPLLPRLDGLRAQHRLAGHVLL